jgi:hypothetical protein
LLGANSYTESDTRPSYYLKGRELDWYLQDTWKATIRLTVDYGMRMMWFSPMTQGNNTAADFIPELYDRSKQVILYQPVLSGGKRVAVNPLTGELFSVAYIGGIVPGSGNVRNGMLSATDPSAPSGFRYNRDVHFGPRFGFAYALTGGAKTVFRAGMGVVYQTQSFAADCTPLVDNVQTVPTIFNGTFDTFDPRSGVLFPTSVTGRDLNLKTPTIYTSSAGIQRALGFATLLEVAYVGTLGRQVTQTQNADTVPYGAHFLPVNGDPTNGSPLPDNYYCPYMGYSAVSLLRTASSYHSLQIQLNRRFARHVQYRGLDLVEGAGIQISDRLSVQHLSLVSRQPSELRPDQHRSRAGFEGELVVRSPRLGTPHELQAGGVGLRRLAGLGTRHVPERNAVDPHLRFQQRPGHHRRRRLVAAHDRRHGGALERRPVLLPRFQYERYRSADIRCLLGQRSHRTIQRRRHQQLGHCVVQEFPTDA